MPSDNRKLISVTLVLNFMMFRKERLKFLELSVGYGIVSYDRNQTIELKVIK